MTMQTFPLASLSVKQAKQVQFAWIDSLTRHFRGNEFLDAGDLGLESNYNKPIATHRMEMAIADFFAVEAAILVRGAGTGAIREALHAVLPPSKKLLVHQAPIYPTTKQSLDMLKIETDVVDFHDWGAVKSHLVTNSDLGAVLIQHTRQKIDDSYDPVALCQRIKEAFPNMPVIFDDNYAVMKVKKIGVDAGADLSCFSCFKLLGPEGIGCIVGKSRWIAKIQEGQYSGGSQVQGPEAMEVGRGLAYAPVALALQAEVNEELVCRLRQGEISGIRHAFLANAQSKVLLVEFDQNIAKAVLKKAEQLGASPRPVGAESKYELLPMFYRVSGTFRKADPSLEERMIRINPMRAGADTILRILREAVKEASDVSC